jgi:hypothetical protein
MEIDYFRRCRSNQGIIPFPWLGDWTAAPFSVSGLGAQPTAFD